MSFACGITKAADTHSYYDHLLLLHGSNSYISAPKYYVYTYFAYLV